MIYEIALFPFYKMAARPRREKGYYASLNSVSSVDLLPKTRKERKIKGRGRLWQVERLIAKRDNAAVSRNSLFLSNKQRKEQMWCWANDIV